MMGVSTFTETLLDCLDMDDAFVLETLAGVVREIKADSKAVIDAVSEAVDDAARKNDLCPECFEELEHREYRESRHAPGEAPCYEDLAETFCPNCGLTL